MSTSKKSDALRERFGTTIRQAVAPRPGGAPVPEQAAAPDRYAGAVKSRAFAELPVDAIVTDPQCREQFDEDEIARLAVSIRSVGQITPIRVRYDEARGVWVVLVGECRLRACRRAGLERVRVELVERDMAEKDVLAEQVVENMVRSSLRPVEAARAYQRLMELNGWTMSELAGALGIDLPAASRALAMLRLPEDIAEQVDAGAIKTIAAYELSKLRNATDQREVAAKIVREGLDQKATIEEVRRRPKNRTSRKGRGAKPQPGRLPAEIRRRGPNGCRIVIHPTSRHGLADVAADLRAVADALEAEGQGDGRGADAA